VCRRKSLSSINTVEYDLSFQFLPSDIEPRYHISLVLALGRIRESGQLNAGPTTILHVFQLADEIVM